MRDLPQWVKSRLKAVAKKKDCGGTHGLCRCFLEKLIHLEAEVSKLREENRKYQEDQGKQVRPPVSQQGERGLQGPGGEDQRGLGATRGSCSSEAD